MIDAVGRQVHGKAETRQPKPRTRAAKPDNARSVSTVPENSPSDVTPAQYLFCLEYLKNGFNATQAYLTAHPGVTYHTARMEGSRTLANPCIREYVRSRLKQFWMMLHMSGDEALARVALDARADLRDLFDENGKLLKPQEWSFEIANSIEAYELRGDGGFKIKLTGKLAARRIILEQTGKLKGLGDGFDALAAAIRADLEKHGEHRD